MTWSRREFAKGVVCLGGTLLVGCEGPEEDESLFPCGVCAGDPGTDSVVLSTTYLGDTLNVRLWSASETREETVAIEDGMACIEVNKLTPDTEWQFYFLDGDQRRSSVGRFRTNATGAKPIRFGASSCLGNTGTLACLERAAEDELDFFVLLGDTIYGDSCHFLAEYRDKWDRQLTTREGLRALLASTGVYATWDDHELTNN